MSDPAPLSFGARFFYAWACFFKVLFDGTFAARAKALEAPAPAFVKEDPAGATGNPRRAFRGAGPQHQCGAPFRRKR